MDGKLYYALGNVGVESQVELFYPFYAVDYIREGFVISIKLIEPVSELNEPLNYTYSKEESRLTFYLNKPKITEEESYLLFRNKIVPTLLEQEMIFLHGSVVEKNGLAICFLGDNGVGKTCAALSFVAKGFTLLADSFFLLNVNTFRINAPSWRSKQVLLWSEAEKYLNQTNYRCVEARSALKSRFLLESLNTCSDAEISKIILMRIGENREYNSEVNSKLFLYLLKNVVTSQHLIKSCPHQLFVLVQKIISSNKIMSLTRDENELDFSAYSMIG